MQESNSMEHFFYLKGSADATWCHSNLRNLNHGKVRTGGQRGFQLLPNKKNCGFVEVWQRCWHGDVLAPLGLKFYLNLGWCWCSSSDLAHGLYHVVSDVYHVVSPHAGKPRVPVQHFSTSAIESLVSFNKAYFSHAGGDLLKEAIPRQKGLQSWGEPGQAHGLIFLDSPAQQIGSQDTGDARFGDLKVTPVHSPSIWLATRHHQ